MRSIRFWWNSLLVAAQQNPPHFVERLMLLLSMIFVGIWLVKPDFPYMVLSLSYSIGTGLLIFIREGLAPLPQPQSTHVRILLFVAMFLALTGLYMAYRDFLLSSSS